MIQRVENQRQVTNHLGTTREVAANVNRFSGINSEQFDAGATGFLARSNQGNQRGKKDNTRLKNARFCDHCQKNGHTKDQCFKLGGYPDWYEGPRDGAKSRKPAKFAANVQGYPFGVDTPLEDMEGTQETTGSSIADSNLIQALAQEMMKLIKGKQSEEQQQNSMNAYAHFAGTAPISSQSNVCCAKNNDVGSWIVDTGASDHMTSNSTSFDLTKYLSQPV